MNVAILGLGNIGTVFAAHLTAGARHRVFACVRRPPDPLVVQGEFGTVSAQVEWFTEDAPVPPTDWILLATKTQQTAQAAAAWFPKLTQAGAVVVVLQNGVDALARVAPLSPALKVIPTVVYTNSKRLGPGHIRHLRPEYDLAVPPSSAAKDLIELVDGTPLKVKEDPEFLTSAWRKYLANLVANPLTALLGRGIGALRGAAMERLATQVMEEAATVGRAEGAKLGPDVVCEVLTWMKTFPADTGTSMLEDRLAGRALESEAFTGTLLRLGAKHGIALPANEMLMALLLGIDSEAAVL